MRISVVGAGYVGLVTGACLAKLGNEVTLIDIDEKRVEEVNNKISPICEEGLGELLNSAHIEASSNFQKITDSEVIFICVGTPCADGEFILLEQVEKASKEVGQVLRAKRGYCVVCVKSTVVPGATEEIIIPALEESGRKAGKDFGICMSPEFLREGRAVYDFMNPARIIVGEYDGRSGSILLKLYRSFNAPILRTNLKTAEMIKLASNTFLAAKISLINEIGNICKHLGIDVYEVAEGMGLDERIGSKFLNAGVGFGGSCLPKDLMMLIGSAKKVGYAPQILEQVLNLNEAQALRLVELLRKNLPLKGAAIGVLGLAFKPGTDDIRESRAIKIVEALLQEGAAVKAYDPIAVENFKKLFPQIEYGTKEEVLNSDAVLIITEWDEFNELNYKGKIVIDGRRIPRAREARIYEGICW